MKIIYLKLIYLTLISIEPKEIQTKNIANIILNKLTSNDIQKTNQFKLIDNNRKRIKRSQLNYILNLSLQSEQKSNIHFIRGLEKIVNQTSANLTSYSNETVEFSEPQTYEYFVCDSESLSFMYSRKYKS